VRRAENYWKDLGLLQKSSAPVYGFFLLLERLYQFYRIRIVYAYVSAAVRQQLPVAGSDAAGEFPWSTPFFEGVLGPLFKPEKSIFLFDPLLVLAIWLLVVLWKRLPAEVRAYGVAPLLLLLGYISFYASIPTGRETLPGAIVTFRRQLELAALLARTVVAAISRKYERMDLARWNRDHRRQLDHSDCLACLLVAAGKSTRWRRWVIPHS